MCGDPNSVMPAWLEPAGPLNYREVEEIISWILATSDTEFIYVPAHAEADATLPPPVDVQGWRDPNFTPAPGATPVPACWRAPGSGGTAATPAPVESPGTAENPRVIEIEASADLQWVDPGDRPAGHVDSASSRARRSSSTSSTRQPTRHNFHLGSGGRSRGRSGGQRPAWRGNFQRRDARPSRSRLTSLPLTSRSSPAPFPATTPRCTATYSS